MKILVVTNMYPTKREPWSGVFVAEQVEDLRALGIDVSVYSFNGRADWKEYLRAARWLRRRAHRNAFDIVHAHYGLTGAVALAQRATPVITTFRGSDTFVPWQRTVSYLVARLTVPLFVSDLARARLRRPSATVVPSAVDVKRFRPRSRAAARRLLGWKQSGIYVLLPGSRRTPIKNAALFDASLDALPIDLRVRRIALEGYTRDETALVMNAVDVALMTSISEGSPVAVREALACETPVVSVRVGDVPRLLQDLPGCAVCERDPAALAEAVLQALEAPRSPLLRERAVEYSRERVARKVLKVYEEVISQRS
jgi:glycosyltransferase involved in cell wall biosynthesis